MAQPSLTQHIDLPIDAIGVILGKGKSKFFQIQKESGAKMVLDKQPRPEDESLKRLNFQGTSQQVQHASVLVLEVLARWCESDPKNSDKVPQSLRPDVARAQQSKKASVQPQQVQAVPEQLMQTQSNSMQAQPEQPVSAPKPAGAPPQPVSQPAPQPAPQAAPQPTLGVQTVTLELPVSSMSFVIGQHGESLPEMERRSGARVWPVRTGQNEFALEITGTFDAIQRAKHLLMQIMAMWNAAEKQRQLMLHQQHMQQYHQQQQFLAQQQHQQAAMPPQVAQTTQQAPPQHAPPQQASFQQAPLQAPHILQAPQQAPPQAAQAVQHPPPAAEQAPAKIAKTAADKTGAQRLEVQVPSGAAGMIVGKKAAQIKRFRVECGVKVSVKQDSAEDAATKVVTIEGAQGSVDQGLTMLSETLAVWASSFEDEARKQPQFWLQYLRSQVPAPTAAAPEPPAAKAAPKTAPSGQSPAAGSTEASANQQQQQQPAALKGGRGGGSEKAQEKAASNQDRGKVKLEVQVPAGCSGAILGKHGKTVQGIQSKTGASLSLAHHHVPGDPSKRCLSMEGSRESVQAARGMIVDIVGNWLAMEAVGQKEVSQQQRREGREQAEQALKDKLTVVKEASQQQPSAADDRQAHAPGQPQQSGKAPPAAAAAVPGDHLETVKAGEDKMELHVSVPAAAMIIGKKGSMLKLLIAKSGAKVTLEHKDMADGRKKVCIEGSAPAVHKAHKMVQDILRQCDDVKYEEAAKRKAEEEDSVRKAEEADKKKRQQAELAEKEKKRLIKEEEERAAAKKAAEYQRLEEKKLKAAAELEAKRKLNQKMASNPFEFLHGESDEDDEDEDEDEEQESAPPPKEKDASKKKKKKSKGGAKANGMAGVTEGKAGAAHQGNRHGEDASSEDSDIDEDHANLIGLDRMLHSIHQELGQLEGTHNFSPRRDQSNNRTSVSEEGGEGGQVAMSRVSVGSLTRRGIEHANEDRMALLEFSDLLSEATRKKLLMKSSTGSMPLFAVFDGHGGDGASERCSKQLPQHIADVVEEAAQNHGDDELDVASVIAEALSKGFDRMEETLMHAYKEQNEKSGTCACVVIMHDEQGQGILSIANLGDCRAIIGRGESRSYLSCVSLTTDHRANFQEERARIEKAGGFVKDKRALGDLIPSRSLGDFKTKEKCIGAVIATPDVTKHVLQPNDRMLLLASDGLWDDLKKDRVMDIAGKARTPDSCVKEIAKAVIKKYGAKSTKPNDDLTVLACFFNN